MVYEERLTCFVDLLGFGEAIKQSVEEAEIAEALHRLLGEFKNGGLEAAIYAEIPYLDESGMRTLGDIHGDDILVKADPDFGLVATQFSDSFVISAPANNPAACLMLVKAIRIIHQHFFFSLGMLMRGGISVGLLHHERGGALFGPAMNEAYLLESKSAIYARVVISQKAKTLLGGLLQDQLIEKNFFTGFDGLTSFDLASIFSGPNMYADKLHLVEEQLEVVEQDILKRNPSAHPKIAYLKNRWAAEKERLEIKYSKMADSRAE